MTSESEPRKLKELRVVDIRFELEKRNMDKNGIKAVLLEKLEKALKDEGHDPETYLFEPAGKGTPKRSRRGEGDESESMEVSEDDKEGEVSKFDVDDNQYNSDIESEKETNEGNISDGGAKEKNEVRRIKEENINVCLATDKTQEEKKESTKESPSKDLKKIEVKLERVEDQSPSKSASEESSKPSEDTTPDKSKIKSKETSTSKPCPASRKSGRIATSEENKNSSEDQKETPEKLSVKIEHSETSVKSVTEKKTPTKTKEEKPKTECKIEVQEDEKSAPETNGIDNEDSINLTIGEDEEKLLADEEDVSQDKDNKDESLSGAGQHKHSSGEKIQDKISSQDKDVKSGNAEEAAKDDKAKKPAVASSSSSRNLWVSGLSSTTRATDLKQVFSKFGKVVGAKVVTNARTPGARCYGYVTMASSEDASKAIESLHLTELHGRMISVEKAKGDSTGPPKRNTEATKNEQTMPKKVEEKKKDRVVVRTKPESKSDESLVPPGTEGDTLKTEPAAPGTETDVSMEVEAKDKDSSTHRSRGAVRTDRSDKRPRSTTSSHRSRDRNNSKHRKTSPNVLTFFKIKEEREKQILREKERSMREEQRRRDSERQRQREIDRKQREEYIKLERERQKLKLERERVERERSELIKLKRERQRLERERQRLEREKLEREKEELERLKRQTLSRLEEERRKRSLSRSRDREYEGSRKRPAPDVRYDNSHSRFPDSSRYVERAGGTFRTQDESVPSRSKSERHPRERYQETSKGERYAERPVESWHGSNVGMKSFGSSGNSGRDTWVSGASERKVESSQSWPRPPTNANRWSGGGGPIMNNRGPQVGPGSIFPPNMESGLPGLGMMGMGGPFGGSGGNRFDSYKLPY